MYLKLPCLLLRMVYIAYITQSYKVILSSINKTTGDIGYIVCLSTRNNSISHYSKDYSTIVEDFIKLKVEPYLKENNLLGKTFVTKDEQELYKNHDYIYTIKKNNKYIYETIDYGDYIEYKCISENKSLLLDKEDYNKLLSLNKSITFDGVLFCMVGIMKHKTNIRSFLYGSDSTKIVCTKNQSEFDLRRNNCVVVPKGINSLYKSYINNTYRYVYYSSTQVHEYNVTINKIHYSKGSVKSKEEAFAKFKSEVIEPIIEPLLRQYRLID